MLMNFPYLIANTIFIYLNLISMSKADSTIRITDEEAIGLIKKDIPISP